MNTYTTLFGIMLLVMPLVLVSCDGCNKPLSELKREGECTYVFMDNSPPRMSYVFALHGATCFAEVAGFPGYTGRKFYLNSALPEAVSVSLNKLIAEPGQLEPPFVPGGVHFARVTVNPGQPTQEIAYFKNSNAAVRQWLVELRDAVIQDKNAVSDTPTWVSAAPDVRKWFGM